MAENETSNDSSVCHFETITVKVEIVESDPAQEDFQDSNTEADPDKIFENPSSAGQPQKPKKRMRKKMEPKLECDQCDYRTPYRRCLYYHKISHEQNPTPLACELCTYRTKYPQSLERHTITKHHADEVEPTFRCTECPYKAIFKSDLKAHKRKHSTDKKYKCNLCDYSTVYHNLLKKHVRVHHCDKEVFKCDKCSFKAKAEGYLIRHMSKAHNELTKNAIKCENCDFMTKVRWRLNIHKRKSYLGVPVSCEHCSFSSMFKCEFKLHKKIHIKQIGNPSEKLMNCPENDDSNPVSITENDTNKKSAQKTFTQIDEEKLDEMEWGNIPVKEIPTDKLFQCTLCDYSSKYKASVQRHFQRRHMTNKKPYKCTNCNFSTNTKDQLSLHTKRSKCTKLQICNICNYNTYYKCQLVSHQKNHNPFKCEHCDYTCKTEYYLQQHFTNVHLKN